VALAEAFRRAAATGRDELKKMGESGRAYAAQNLSPESNLPRVLHLLYLAAAGRQAGPRRRRGISIIRLERILETKKLEALSVPYHVAAVGEEEWHLRPQRLSAPVG